MRPKGFERARGAHLRGTPECLLGAGLQDPGNLAPSPLVEDVREKFLDAAEWRGESIMEHQQHGSASEGAQSWRTWLWLAGCLAPLVAVVAIWVFNVPVNTVLLVGLFLLCPLVHFFMMRGGEHKH